MGLHKVVAERVAEPQSWRYESRLGAEQLRAELGLLERAYARAQKSALDLANSALRGGDGELRPDRLVVE